MIEVRRTAALAMLATLAGALGAGCAFANDGDADAGRAKFVLCASCHGGDGRSGVLPEYPKIAGQSRKYLVNALKAYQGGRRIGTYASLMAESARLLTDADIDNLAAYLSGLDDTR